jgi:transcriptional regulator with XRE-family HTH domain
MDTKTKIKQAREEKNFGQEYVAHKLGLSQNAYSRLENGHTKLDFDKAIKLSEILEKPVWEFLPKEFQAVNFSTNNSQEVVKNAYILYECQKEVFEATVQTFKEELEAARNERSEERTQFIALIEKFLNK